MLCTYYKWRLNFKKKIEYKTPLKMASETPKYVGNLTLNLIIILAVTTCYSNVQLLVRSNTGDLRVKDKVKIFQPNNTWYLHSSSSSSLQFTFKYVFNYSSMTHSYYMFCPLQSFHFNVCYCVLNHYIGLATSIPDCLVSAHTSIKNDSVAFVVDK